MSTVQATNLKSALSTTNNAVMTAGGDFTNAAGISYMGGSKNLLINGAMQVHQRSTSVTSITGGGYYTVDRWNTSLAALGTWTQSIENDAPTGSGFRKSLKMLCTTADVSPTSNDECIIEQRLEGQDVQRIAKGTSSAQQLTLSFWVKSNVTGTYTILVYDIDNVRSVSASYTISQSAVWEKKVISFPADTTGIFDNDNNVSLFIRFHLALGTNFTSGTLQTSWGSDVAANRGPGQINLASATNNYWQITGTQLEIGSAATSFEFEPYETTLRKCQRYFYPLVDSLHHAWQNVGHCTSTTEVWINLPIPVQMRTTPVLIDNNLRMNVYSAGVSFSNCSMSANYTSLDACGIRLVTGSAFTAGRAAHADWASGSLFASAEL